MYGSGLRLRQHAPRLATRTWLGAWPVARHAVIANLVNHTPTPVEDGWSVRIARHVLLDLPASADLVADAVFADDVGPRRAPARTPLARRDAAAD